MSRNAVGNIANHTRPGGQPRGIIREMSVEVLQSAHFVDQATCLRKPSQTAPQGAEFATVQNMPKRADVGTRITAERSELRPEHPERFAEHSFRKISDGSANPSVVPRGTRLYGALEGENAQCESLTLQLQNFVADEGFRQTRKHFYDVAYLLRSRDHHQPGSTRLAGTGAGSASSSLN